MPPTPSALTPARRGVPLDGQSVSSLFTRNGLLSKSILGFGFSKCRLAGICRCFKASTALMRLMTPAARSRWPKFVFTDPIAQKPRFCVPDRKARVNASISIGSPIDVAVPCASI